MHTASISIASAAAAVEKVSKVTTPAPEEDDLRQLVLATIKCLGDGDEEFDWPETVSIQAEWTG
ncbi:hypothetical protein BDR22DRAFT_639195 [Usnea florida]